MAAARKSFRNRFSMRWSPAKWCLHDDGLANALGLIGNFELRSSAPQTLEIVKSPRLFPEDMYDKPAEIEERPFRRASPFAMFRRALKFLVKLLFNFGTDRLHLRSAEAGANDEV